MSRCRREEQSVADSHRRGRATARPVIPWGAVPGGSEGRAQGILTRCPRTERRPVALGHPLQLLVSHIPRSSSGGSCRPHCQTLPHSPECPPSAPPGASSHRQAREPCRVPLGRTNPLPANATSPAHSFVFLPCSGQRPHRNWLLVLPGIALVRREFREGALCLPFHSGAQ